MALSHFKRHKIGSTMNERMIYGFWTLSKKLESLAPRFLTSLLELFTFRFLLSHKTWEAMTTICSIVCFSLAFKVRVIDSTHLTIHSFIQQTIVHSSIIRRFDNLCLLAFFARQWVDKTLPSSGNDHHHLNHLAMVLEKDSWVLKDILYILSYGIISGVDNRDNIFIDGKRSKGDAKQQRERFVFKIKYYLYLYAACRRAILYPSS